MQRVDRPATFGEPRGRDPSELLGHCHMAQCAKVAGVGSALGGPQTQEVPDVVETVHRPPVHVGRVRFRSGGQGFG